VLYVRIVRLEAFVEFFHILVPLLVVEALILTGSLFKMLILFSHFVGHRD
jgi:hypothetical protein